ncbi:MAG: CpaF family protein [Proteobacteria bacterium]|nr:MAG: CpaF family protein [Pseudomonadota bacterium]
MGVYDQSIAVFLAPIKEFLADESVTEVLINGPKEIWIERKGKLTLTDVHFHDETALQAAVRNIAQYVKRTIDNQNPQLDARLPDGSRIHAVLPPSARKGTTVAIRKFSKAADLSFAKLISFGSISPEGAEFLTLCVGLAKNIIVSGGTGSGKTTFLNLLGGLLPKDERLMVVEDASELQIDAPHVVCFETKAADHEGKGALTIRDLVRSAMRLRPDRIVVGEVRGPEALDLITVMNTGHGGSMGTTHANTPTDALVRLETLATMGDTSIPLAALRRQIAGAVHLVVQAKRLHDGSRKITNISEVLGVDEHGRYETQDIFKFVQTGIDENHKILGRMEGMGIIPTFYEEIEVNGLSFDIAKFGTPPKPKYPKTTTALNTASGHGAPAAHGHAPAAASHAPAPASANNPAVAAAMAKLSPAQLAQLNAGAAKAGMPVQAYYQALIKQQAAKKNGGQAA